MATEQGDLSLLDDPVAQELLHSTNLARLAYTWHDGTPRVVPIWFHWDGEAIVLGSPPNAPKVNVLPDNSKVALTIDRDEFPYHALLIRGTAHVETVEGVTQEYAACAERYFGEEQGREWVEGVSQMSSHMTRISVRPEWVSILDFETRFPSAIAETMSGQCFGYLRSGGRGSADGGEAQGAVERGTESVSASFASRKEERDRDRSSEREAVCVA